MAGKVTRQSAAPAAVNIGDLGTYQSGGGIPNGMYILFFDAVMYQATKKDGSNAGPARLGIMVTAHKLDNPTEEPLTQFYSMGTKAHESFQPNPETGKGIVPIPGGAGGGLYNSSNWSLLLKSMYDSGLPVGIFSNDLTVIDGVHANLENVPEPEERASFRSATAEAEGQTAQQNRKVAIITEIMDDGKPWEGTGGLPEAAAAPAAPAKVNGKAGKPTPAPAAQAPAAAGDDEDILTAAVNGISTVLDKNPNGLPKLKLRTLVFPAIKAELGDDMAQAVSDKYLSNDAELKGLLEQLSFTLQGAMVKPATA